MGECIFVLVKGWINIWGGENRVSGGMGTLLLMKSMKICNSVTFYFMKPESIHTKDESKRGFAFAFIFGVN